MITVGIFGDLFNSAVSEPSVIVNSSSTIFTICCAGDKLSSTSTPTARSRTRLVKSLTTCKLTSASSKARRISRIISFTSASDTFPFFLIFPIACWRRSVKLSNAIFSSFLLFILRLLEFAVHIQVVFYLPGTYL